MRLSTTFVLVSVSTTTWGPRRLLLLRVLLRLLLLPLAARREGRGMGPGPDRGQDQSRGQDRDRGRGGERGGGLLVFEHFGTLFRMDKSPLWSGFQFSSGFFFGRQP